MMTLLSGDGASFLGAFLSPPGWYWYAVAPPVSFHGSLSFALAMEASEVAEVGERAGIVY
jgi:hypothetical protein